MEDGGVHGPARRKDQQGVQGRQQQGQRQLTQEAIRDIKHEGRRGLCHHVEAALKCCFKLSYLNSKMGLVLR